MAEEEGTCDHRCLSVRKKPSISVLGQISEMISGFTILLLLKVSVNFSLTEFLSAETHHPRRKIKQYGMNGIGKYEQTGCSKISVSGPVPDLGSVGAGPPLEAAGGARARGGHYGATRPSITDTHAECHVRSRSPCIRWSSEDQTWPSCTSIGSCFYFVSQKKKKSLQK